MWTQCTVFVTSTANAGGKKKLRTIFSPPPRSLMVDPLEHLAPQITLDVILQCYHKLILFSFVYNKKSFNIFQLGFNYKAEPPEKRIAPISPDIVVFFGK